MGTWDGTAGRDAGLIPGGELSGIGAAGAALEGALAGAGEGRSGCGGWAAGAGRFAAIGSGVAARGEGVAAGGVTERTGAVAAGPSEVPHSMHFVLRGAL